MGGLLAGLRSGDWLTRERIRLIALAVLVASGGGLAFLLATSDGLNDYRGRPLGTDFSNVYAAGTYVRERQPAAPFDPPLQHAREQAIFGANTPFYGWHYPPFFLFVAVALALLPYGFALLTWQAATLALYLAAMRAVLVFSPAGEARRQAGAPAQASSSAGGSFTPTPPPPHHSPAGPLENNRLGLGLGLLLALAFPAVFVNLAHGHNGFLTAALLGGALVALDARPVLAGVLFGLLAYKPQFGLMIPLVLLASGRWRSLLTAGATVALLAAVATLAFGPEIWGAFLASTRFTRDVVLEQGQTGWHKIQSVFSWVRMWGGPIALAYAVQGAVTVAIAAALVWLWRGNAAYLLKAAALCLAAILATPYSLDYDLMVLAPAIAFLAVHGLAHGFSPYEKSALGLLWLVPLIARGVAEATLVPLGVIAMLVVLGLTLRKAMRTNAMDSDAVPGHPRAPATPRESTR
jgi:hypothetical protein